MELDQLHVDVFRRHGEGRYRDALALIDEAADQAPADAAAKLAFWRACLLALDGDREAALEILERAAAAGCWWHPGELADDDLASAPTTAPLRTERRGGADGGGIAARSEQPGPCSFAVGAAGRGRLAGAAAGGAPHVEQR